jgi:hypothetical protein
MDILVFGELVATDAIVALNHHVAHIGQQSGFERGSRTSRTTIARRGVDLWWRCGGLNGNRHQPEGELPGA